MQNASSVFEQEEMETALAAYMEYAPLKQTQNPNLSLSSDLSRFV